MTADAEARNAATQARDGRSVLALHRRLLALRREREELQSGDIAFAAAGDPDVLAYRRGPQHVVALNFSAQPRPAAWPAGAQLVLSTHLDRDAGTPAPVLLRGGEGVVAQLS
jgi:alpha-glucosidase